MKQEPERQHPGSAGEQLVYLYCITRAKGLRDTELEGLDDRQSISIVEEGDAAAVVGPVPRADFEGETAAINMKDLAWLAPRALRHEALLNTLMRSRPVLPARFGTVFFSRHALEEFLGENREQIARLLDEFEDKQEWSVKAFTDASKAVDWSLAADPAMSREHERLPASPGARYFQEKRLRDAAKGRSREGSRAAAEQVQKELKELAPDVRALKLQPKELTGKKEDMVLNCACLLPGNAADNFCRSVEEMADRYASQGLIIEASGPWPPHSFCPCIGDGDQAQ